MRLIRLRTGLIHPLLTNDGSRVSCLESGDGIPGTKEYPFVIYGSYTLRDGVMCVRTTRLDTVGQNVRGCEEQVTKDTTSVQQNCPPP